MDMVMPSFTWEERILLLPWYLGNDRNRPTSPTEDRTLTIYSISPCHHVNHTRYTHYPGGVRSYRLDMESGTRRVSNLVITHSVKT